MLISIMKFAKLNRQSRGNQASFLGAPFALDILQQSECDTMRPTSYNVSYSKNILWLIRNRKKGKINFILLDP